MFANCIRIKCGNCHKLLILDRFHRCKVKNFGRHTVCKLCCKKWSNDNKTKIRNTPQSKKCTKCNKIKPANEFSKNKQTKTGLTSSCSKCMILYQERTRDSNLEPISEKICSGCKILKPSSEFYRNKRVKCGLEPKCKNCDFIRKDTEEKREFRRLRKENKKLAKLKDNVSGNIYYSLKNRGLSKEGSKTFDHLPYLPIELYDHLIWSLIFLNGYEEEDFHRQNKMGRAILEVDHIKPHSSFLYKDLKDPLFVECWSLTNLRLYPHGLNQSKHAKYDPEFHEWFIEQMRLHNRF